MKIELIDNWKKSWAMLSMWFFALLGVAPELYDLAVQYDLLAGEAAPVALARMIKIVAFTGAASRIVKQKSVSGAPVQADA